MSKVKMYQSEAWLRRKFYAEKLSPEEIAKLAGCSARNIRIYMTKFGIK